MAMDAGDDWGGSGALPSGSMAEAIYNAMESIMGECEEEDRDERRAICVAIAKGVVDHIVANADVTITTDDAGLQRDPDTLEKTLAPSGEETLEGAIS